MQVADAVAAGMSRTESISTAIASVRVSATMAIPQKEPSPAAMFAMKYIADSTRLSGAEKKTLIRLVAMVDEFTGGDPRIMEKIMGLARLMEMDTASGTYRAHSMREVMERYWQERGELDPDKAVQVHVETEITLMIMEIEKTAALSAENPSNS